MADIDELMDEEFLRVEALDDLADCERLLSRGGAFETLIIKAREQAMAALEMMVQGNFETIEQVRALQWEVRRYDALCQWISEIVDHGETVRESLTEEDDEMLEQILRGDTRKDA